MFGAGEWIIYTDETIEKLKDHYDKNGKKRKGNFLARPVFSSEFDPHGVWDLHVIIKGKKYVDSSKYYRAATEEEIKEAKLMNIFETEE